MRERMLAAVAVLCVACGLALNEWTLRALVSPDGSLEPGTRRAIWLIDAALVAAGAVVFVLRRRLVAWTDRLAVREGDATLRNLLLLGLVLRVVVWVVLAPENNDPHLRFVEFIVESHRLPRSDELIISFHPPLYYVLAAPLAAIGSAKLVQLLSLVLSVVNLLLLHRLISTTRLLSDHAARCHAMALAALLPQLVFFGLFVSNDALAFPLGTLLFVLIFRYVDAPTRGNLALLGVLGGLGLLTKGTFTLAVPAIAAVIVAVHWRLRAGLARHAAALALFGVLAGGVGCYKYVENTVHFGTPVVDNSVLQQEWIERQKGTWQGWSTLVDVNVAKLVRHPTLGEATKHSIPLLFYGTFWYSYVKESNLNATRVFPMNVVPRVIYVLAILPTLLIAAGTVRLLGRGALTLWGTAREMLGMPAARGLRALPEDDFRRRVQELALLALVGLNTLTVVTWGLRHDGWGFFQARLVFPMFFAITVLLGAGIETVRPRRAEWRWALHWALVACYAALLAHLGIEVAAGAARALGAT